MYMMGSLLTIFMLETHSMFTSMQAICSVGALPGSVQAACATERAPGLPSVCPLL